MRTLYFCLWCLLLSSIFLSIFFLVYSQPSQIGYLPYFYTWCGLSANLGCRSETCCGRLAGNAGRKNRPKFGHLCTIAQICRAISSQLKAHVGNRKNVLNSNISSTCLYNMMNFCPLAAQIGQLVWGTPGSFNGFRVLAALLHGILVLGVSETLQR